MLVESAWAAAGLDQGLLDLEASFDLHSYSTAGRAEADLLFLATPELNSALSLAQEIRAVPSYPDTTWTLPRKIA